MASEIQHSAVAGDFANIANPTDGRTPSVLSVWSDMQRSAPAPEGASSVSAGGKAAHGLQLELPPAIVSPSLQLSYQQGSSAHSFLGRGWSLTSGVQAHRPTGSDLRAYVAVNGQDLSEAPLDVLVVSGDGLDGVLFLTPSGWEWESKSPSTVLVSEQANGDFVLRSGTRRWELAEVHPNVYRTLRTDDLSGNRVDYSWDGTKLLQIDYGGHSAGGPVTNHVVRVELVYQSTEHTSYSSSSGALEVIDERLDEVLVSTSLAGGGAPQLRKTYTLEYNLADATYAADEVLLEVRELGSAGEDRLVQRFEYSALDIDGSEFQSDTQPRWLGQSGSELEGEARRATQTTKMRFEDWTHDGLPDVVDGYGVPNINAMVRDWGGTLGDVFYYNLPTALAEPYDWGLRPPDGALTNVDGLDQTEVRAYSSWDQGTQWGKNATFTTVKFADVDSDGWLDRIRVTEWALDAQLDDTTDAVKPSHDVLLLGGGFEWEVCYGEGGHDAWDFDCHTVDAPFLASRIGFSKVMPYAEAGVVDEYENADGFVDMLDVDHDGWLDIVYHDGSELLYYPKLGDAAAPVQRRAQGWTVSAGVPLESLDMEQGLFVSRNLVDTDNIQIETDAETTVPAVYLSEELATLRDLNGDGRQDRIVVPEDFDQFGLWEVWLADDVGFSGPYPWPAPAPYIGRSDEGFPTSIVMAVPYCPDGNPWAPEVVDQLEIQEFEAGGVFIDGNVDPAASAKEAFEDAWAELGEIYQDQLEQDAYLQDWFSDFEMINLGRPRLIIAGLIDVDADGRPDFVDGEDGAWYRNLGDGFDLTGQVLPTWWPTREAKLGPSGSDIQPVHVLESSLTTQFVFGMSHCELDGSVEADQVVGSDSVTDTKMRVMDANGDGLLDVVSGAEASVRPKGITYAGGFEPQEPPGLLKRVTSGTLLDVDFDYMSSVEVFPNGHAEQTEPLMGASLGAEMLVESMTVMDPFQPLVTPDPQVFEAPLVDAHANPRENGEKRAHAQRC